jgi:CBS domain containing-hemolysin-like protein
MPAYRQIDADNWQVDGLMTLGQLERLLEFELDEDVDANSVSGLLMQRLERMPLVGDEIEDSGYRFLVLDINGSRVGQVAISRAVEEKLEDEAGQAGNEDAPRE